jgi:hypothetical protein
MLSDMKKRGIQIIFAGGLPTCVDGKESEKAEKFALDCDCIPFTRDAITSELAHYCTIEMFSSNGKRTDKYIYQEKRKQFLMSCFLFFVL